MSCNSVKAAATRFDLLNGSTIGTVTGTTTYAATGPLGRQQFVGDGSSYISYTPPTFPTTATLACWLKIPTNDQGVPFSLRNSFLTYSSRDSHIIFGHDGGSKNINAVDLPDDTLFHFAITADGTSLRYYINGTQAGSTACSNLVATGNDFLRLLGSHGTPPNSGATLAASASEFGYWNYALSAADIGELVANDEPVYTSGGIVLNADLTYSDTLVWDSQSNGTVTETTHREYYNGSAWVTDTDAFSIPVSGRSYRVRIAASNNGGNDSNEDQVSNTVVYAMSYHTVKADAILFDPLNGSTIGTVTGTTTWAADGPLGRQAFVGNGSSYINYTPVAFPTRATLAGWFKIPTNDSGAMFALRNAFLTFNPRDTHIVYAFDGGAKQITSVNLPDNTLFHLAITADGTNLKYYINGTQAGTTACGNLSATGGDILRLFSNQNANPGDIPAASASEFGYWNYALSAGEITKLVGLEEPDYTSGLTFNATTGAWDVGTWNSYSNGTIYYTVRLHNDADDSLVAELQTHSTSTSGNCLDEIEAEGDGTYYIKVLASNSGGMALEEITDSATSSYSSEPEPEPEPEPEIPAPETPEAVYVEIGAEFTFNNAKQIAESNGECKTLVIPIAPSSFIKRTDTTIPEKTRDFDFSNKYKRGH